MTLFARWLLGIMGALVLTLALAEKLLRFDFVATVARFGEHLQAWSVVAYAMTAMFGIFSLIWYKPRKAGSKGGTVVAVLMGGFLPPFVLEFFMHGLGASVPDALAIGWFLASGIALLVLAIASDWQRDGGQTVAA